ncbi:MAG: diguanylate cyclase [Clostridia bacterium]|nr:diguanylate cyclase [Clostridia bacterium]
MNKEQKQKRHVKSPIRKSLLIMMIVMFAVLCVIMSVIASVFFSRSLYAQFDAKLIGVITYIENNIDADDMKTCLKTGVPSEKYNETQLFLNNMIDDLGFKYIYIVIPEDPYMVNLISATSAEEFAAGADNIPLLEKGDWYTSEELAKYAAYWDAEGVSFFEETDMYEGVAETRYVGCKPLRDSNGETIALICVDLVSTELHSMVISTVIWSIVIVAIVFALFGVSLGIWMYKNVTKPLGQLEESAYKFASENNEGELKYNDPGINSDNEVGSLAVAIKKMTAEIDAYIKEREEADIKIRIAEEENKLLAEKAASAAKIAELSQSVADLLNNMPALTFCKDIESGRYLACNQAFAEYACKRSAHDVVGLTDFEIFDKDTATHFSEDDKKAVSLDRPYMLLETVPNANGEMKTFQTTKLKFKDASGEYRLLGMCVDLTEMANMRRESEKAQEAYEEAMSTSLTYSAIARALSTDYSYIYYVNIDTDEFAEYQTQNVEESLMLTRHGTDFFGEARTRALTLIHKDDNQTFIASFTKENVLKNIDESGAFTATYRQIFGDTPVYVNMKATRIKDDPQHIIVGIYSVDTQMKYKETLERLQEEQTTYSRITALSGDFICIYTVDPQTEHFAEYSVKSAYAGLGIEKEGDRFFERSRGENARVIWAEDRDLYLSMLTKENVLKEIKEHGLFTMTYRLTISGQPMYVMLKAAMVEEKDGPQLIIGVSNIDAQVKREKEYDYNLSVARSKANIDALTGVKNKHAYIDAEAALNEMIEDGEPAEFAVIVFDVNGLKIVNDTQGHRAGDALIRSACNIICQQFKHSPVFRVGGDEFAVIAQESDYRNIDELIANIAEENRKNKETGGTVVACGMARYTNERNVSEVFEKADKAMYINKRMLKGETV